MQVLALEACEAQRLRWKQLAEIQQSHEETLAQEEAMWRQVEQQTEQLRVEADLNREMRSVENIESNDSFEVM